MAVYCQRTTASWERPFALQREANGIGLESDMWFGDKALVLRSDRAGVIHYCQLGKLAVKLAPAGNWH